MIEKTKEINDSYESVICANKFDLVEEDSMKRMVSDEEINDFKIKEKIDIFNTSTKSGYNINVAFRKLIELILLKQGRKLLGKNELSKKENNLREVQEQTENLLLSIELIGDIDSGKNELFNQYSDYISKFKGIKYIRNYPKNILLEMYNGDNNIDKIDGFLFFFDLNFEQSFKEMKKMINDLSKNIQSNYISIICANKNIDSKYSRETIPEGIKKYGIEKNIEIIEINTKEIESLQNAINILINLIFNRKENPKHNVYKKINGKYSFFNNDNNLSLQISKKEKFVFNIAILGHNKSGKSSLFYKYSENKKIYDGKILLITDSFVIELIIYEYNFEQYKISEKMDGYIFICDITSQKSFEKMKDWINYMKSKNSNNTNLNQSIICITKCDLKRNRQLLYNEINNYGLIHDINVFQTSANTGDNVNKAFEELLDIILLEQDNKKLHKEFLKDYGTVVFNKLNKYVNF